MPTLVPRINVAFSPEVRSAIMECSAASGMSASALVALLMSNTLPVLNAMTQAFRAAKSDPRRAIEMLGQVADHATMEIAQTSLDLRAAASSSRIRRRRRQAKA